MRLPALALALALASIFSAPLHAAVSPIRMEVEQHSSTKAPKAKPGHPALSNLAQHRSLTIKLSNNSADAFDHLVVKYFFLGHDMKDHNIKVLKRGERKSSLVPRGNETVESEEVTSTFTEAHAEVGKGKGKGKGKPKSKKIPASGQKITGYAVQVLNGTKIEAEYYGEPSFKDKVKAAAPSLTDGSANAPAKKSPAKKKKK